jgi:hypothetical protein
MKNIYFLFAACLFFASCGPTTVVKSDSYQSAPVEDVSYQSFYDQLSPYGNWINYPGYGYVWMPNAGPDFQPYATNGNWIYTNAGWTWASNYNWGWAPFHYGRWFYENGYGWMWVPGNEWAPAWVSWRGGGDYYGWAPLGPKVSMDVALSSYNPPSNYWNFVPRQYMGNPNLHNYYVDGSRNVTIINNTTIINNYSGSNRTRYAYAPGPDPNEVRRYSGNNFTQVQLRQANTPGERISGSQYEIYQPRVSNSPAARGDAAGRPVAPARYESFNNVRPSAQYPAYNQQNNNQPSTANPPAQGFGGQSRQQPTNTRPATQDPANNQSPTANHQQPTNTRPATQNPAVIPQPVPANQAASSQAEKSQFNQVQKTPPNSNTVPGTANHGSPQAETVNHPKTTGHPSNPHNPNNGHPSQKKATTPGNKPKPAQPSEQSKSKESNSN